MTEKKMHPIGFWLLLAGIGATIIYTLYELIVVMLVLFGVEAVTNMAMFGVPPEVGDILRWVFIGLYAIVLIAFAIFILIYVISLIKVLRNRTTPRRQRYLRPIWVITILNLIVHFSAIINGGFVSVVGLIISLVIIVGLFLQAKYNPTDNNNNQINNNNNQFGQQ